ncbi:altered inheritance of mitochondria protein 3 [Homalodisca vitripennis]|uniref:altered inheritance of mitochondria protein 3 n=1 Tax=Homalodisca vitripennis TaxID=197043 RepID=UPI001EECF38A|nr:altered inheritance of mitochondria protein 3 [Homalodisca vitripennis]
MLSIWLLASLVQTCLCGGLYQAAAPVSSVEAHGPLARLALDSMGATGGVHYYSGSHVPLAPAPAAVPVAPAGVHIAPAALRVAPAGVHIAQAAVPYAAAAPVDLVHHVPAVADVPVTKYVAQPGYVQKLVDVAKAKVAVAKLQVRRPAIQKQFFDIEERTIVRPVGSAVVELDEPLSKTVSSPFTVIPAGHHTVAQFQQPLAYPVNSNLVSYYPSQIPVQSYPAFIQQTQGVVQIPQQSFPFPQPPQQLPSAPEQPQQPNPPASTPPQQTPSFPQPSNPSLDDSFPNAEFDSSDTVVVDNPDFSRSSIQGNEQPEPNTETDTASGEFRSRSQEQTRNDINEQDTQPDQSAMVQQILNEFQGRQLLRQFFRENDLQPIQRFQQPQPLQFQPLQPFQQAQNSPSMQPQPLQRSQESTSSEENTSAPTESSTETTTQEASSTTTESEIPTLFRSSLDALQPNAQGVQSKSYSSEGQIPSVRNLSPEESQDNQQKLIELLTGRGEISEVSLGRSGVKLSSVGDSGVVRGRVLSVTPSPRTAGDERVSTRRVVVSRPIQTLEEVDIHQPFTKLERVAVHEPALLKTAHTHLARVPTALPVVSRAVAPVLYH